MKFKIYQIDMDRDKNRVKFDNLENTKKHQGFEQIDAGIYDRVIGFILCGLILATAAGCSDTPGNQKRALGFANQRL